MYLQKLQLQGFKSFAPKTNLEFLLSKDGKRGITAIVGPNGSGKSNIADAIRWALGEQSMKAIRGKKGEDIIFSGSNKKTRSGFAEVSLHLNNDENTNETPYSEVVLTRRFYRNGDSEYLLNKNKARLSDVHLLAAKSNIGSKSYSVIGQGMIDKILTLSDEERKDFFNEATGIKQYKIKKEQSLNKLATAKKNLEQVEIVLREIEPRLSSLRKQAKKLEEREKIESELKNLQSEYYGGLWQDIEKKIVAETAKLEKIELKWKRKRVEIKEIQKEFEQIEKERPTSETFLKLQNKYQKLLEEKNRLREKEWKSKGKSTSISINKITEEIDVINNKQKKIIKDLKSGKVEMAIRILQKLENITGNLLKKMRGENIETQNLASLRKEVQEFEQKILNVKKEMEELAQREAKEKNAFFEKQRKLEARQNEIFILERDLNEFKIELARFETKREGLEEEMETEGIKPSDTRTRQYIVPIDKDEIWRKIQKLKHDIDFIGGIDPEAPKEYKNINERYEFLHSESHDLKNSINSLEAVVKELDVIIEKQFDGAFSNINKHFNKYFKILFGGGGAKIIRTIKNEFLEDDELEENKKEKQYLIEIHATPPGKKIKNLEVLSGGEKALSAIALLCAIMANNPSPFVFLDEVDAALDETNSIKFADILQELSKKTQFLVITHNRATMERASVLYGVTMQEDGVSKLLSMKLENPK